MTVHWNANHELNSFSRWVRLSNMCNSSNLMRILTLIVLLAPTVYGEILDRIVAVIDDRFIITLSDVRKERAIESALGGNPGSDESIVDALIERHLVEEQISQFRD